MFNNDSNTDLVMVAPGPYAAQAAAKSVAAAVSLPASNPPMFTKSTTPALATFEQADDADAPQHQHQHPPWLQAQSSTTQPLQTAAPR